MKITILTLFPEMFAGPFDHSIVQRTKEKGLVTIEVINIRDFGIGAHKVVDDTPYGGGIGMVLRVDILYKAITYAKENFEKQTTSKKIAQRVILMSASGKTYKQALAQQYSKLDHLIIVCGHYEGVDERIMHYVDDEISIGDFVLTGGELPAMVITDSVVRLIEGAITQGAVEDESFSKSSDILEYPHYTRPREFDNHAVPEMLLSGDHKKIAVWREEQSMDKTKRVRPDLVKK